MPMMLVGVLVGAGFFVATLWSVLRAFRGRDSLRVAHSAAALLSLFVMGALGVASPLVSAFAGALLVGAAVVAAVLESGFARLFPLSQIAVGVAVAVGMPFAA